MLPVTCRENLTAAEMEAQQGHQPRVLQQLNISLHEQTGMALCNVCAKYKTAHLDDRVWELHTLQHDGRLFITKGFSSDHILQAAQGNDVASAGNLQSCKALITPDVRCCIKCHVFWYSCDRCFAQMFCTNRFSCESRGKHSSICTNLLCSDCTIHSCATYRP